MTESFSPQTLHTLLLLSPKHLRKSTSLSRFQHIHTSFFNWNANSQKTPLHVSLICLRSFPVKLQSFWVDIQAVAETLLMRWEKKKKKKKKTKKLLRRFFKTS